MGICGSHSAERDPEMANQSKKIDRELSREHAKSKGKCKLLILGAGGGGKSTFLNQIRLLHGQGMDEFELQTVAASLRSNVVDLGAGLLTALTKKLELSLDDEAAAFGVNKRHNWQLPDDFVRLLLDLLHTFNYLEPDWDEGNRVADDKAFLAAFDAVVTAAFFQDTILPRLELLRVSDSARYLLANYKRLFAADFVPERQDLVRMRVRTTGVQEYQFSFNSRPIQICDVGGQRSERAKWIHCFSDVTCLLFFVSLAEYDAQLEEDRSTNRMLESLTLFEELTNSRWFSATPVALFLNKQDIFERKMTFSPLHRYFSEFPPDGSVQDGKDFILQKFKDAMANPKMLSSYYTVATDTQLISQVFNSVASTLLSAALENSSLL